MRTRRPVGGRDHYAGQAYARCGLWRVAVARRAASVKGPAGGPVRVHGVRVVVVDTSTPAITAALVTVDGGPVEVLAERVTGDARAHGELLTPQIEAALADAGMRVAEVDAVVAGLGPGPFTGLRVGLVTAAVIGQARGIPTYGVCSLDGLGARTTGLTLVATDARRKEVYWAVYADGQRRGGAQLAQTDERARQL